MKDLSEFNVITAILAILFVLPLIIGAVRPFSREKIEYSIASLLGNIEFVASLLLSIYLTKRIFLQNTGGVYKKIYEWIPGNITAALKGQDVITYIMVVPVILAVLMLLIRIVTSPLYSAAIVPLSNRLYSTMTSANGIFRGTAGALSQVPKSIFILLIAVLSLSFYSYYYPNPVLSKWMNESSVYQVLYKNAVNPVLNSSIAKEIPVLFNDSFSRTMGRITPVEDSRGDISGRLKQLTKGNIRVIEYFNGVTLDEAIKSSPEIDKTALEIVGDEKNSKRKAYLIYKWISKNLKYDYDKAERVSIDSEGISSGSITAFNTKEGICFDYSCLYVSMCRAAGLKVQLVTGLAYSGIAWGDHAWNRVYCSEEDRWINVDTTFGTIGDYFDNQNFSVDHKYDDVQGEW